MTIIYDFISLKLKKILRYFGFDIIQFIPKNNQNLARKTLTDTFLIDMIIDIGANKGQFARLFLQMGILRKFYQLSQ